ncbi:MAG: cobyrinic acid a,c-diamide synthase [Cyanobacteria bacterium QS_3_48_167]|nr:MAG: cobyrinic acid a,c-diamide synthase [Cyanobacteria bacterium QS_3_48_167]
MPTIALVNSKGGVGKSTTAVHFSSWLEKRRKRVILVDADAQESSSRWLDNRESNIEYLAFTDPNRILDSIPKLAEKTDFMVVDAPAGMAETTRAILLRADLAVCPCQPTTLDTDSTEQTLQLIKQAQSVRDGQPYALLLLSKAQRNTKAKKDALHWIKQSGFHWLTSCIHERQIFTRLYDKGLTVWDFENSVSPANQAGAEYEVIFNSILSWENYA